MSWEWDAPTGVYKDHALSTKIREEAAARSVFAQFARPEPGFGRGRGQSVTLTRIRQLALAGRVSELDRLPEGRPGIETKQIQVGEWGFKIPMTEREALLTHFDLDGPFGRMLRDQMRLTLDVAISEAAKTTPYKYIPQAAGAGVFDTDGTPSTTADANLAIADLRKLHDELSGVLKVPPFANGRYVLICTTKAARGIKNDSLFKDWVAPTSREPLVTGQIPFPIENFDIIETNHFSALSNGVGSGSILGEAVAFGDDSLALATVMDPEMRAGMPTDLGRFREMGWVGEFEAGLVWEQAATARLIHVTSA